MAVSINLFRRCLRSSPYFQSTITWSQLSSNHRRFSIDRSSKDEEGQKDTIQEISLTDNCVKHLNRVAETPETMLRVTVEGGGCSGFQYRFNLDTKLNKDDKVFEREGAKIVMDELSLSFLSGSKIDYHQELIRSSFLVVDNPNAEQGCSCGVSFALK